MGWAGGYHLAPARALGMHRDLCQKACAGPPRDLHFIDSHRGKETSHTREAPLDLLIQFPSFPIMLPVKRAGHTQKVVAVTKGWLRVSSLAN